MKEGIIEFGRRDWGRWIMQLYYPTVELTGEYGFRVVCDLFVIRIDPKNKAYGLGLIGFGIAFQKANKKPR